MTRRDRRIAHRRRRLLAAFRPAGQYAEQVVNAEPVEWPSWRNAVIAVVVLLFIWAVWSWR